MYNPDISLLTIGASTSLSEAVHRRHGPGAWSLLLMHDKWI